MEATPATAAPEGVQVRTADGRVARVLLKNPGGWYDIKIDDENGRVQRSFFASDGQDLPRLLASVPKARTDDSAVCTWSEQTSVEGVIGNWTGKKGDLNLPYNTILPFARRPPGDGDQLLVRWANDDGSTREDGYYVCVLRGGQLYGDWEEPVPFNADDDDWLFMNGDGAVTETITISAIAAERGHPENTWGYAGSTVVKSLVPQPVAEWQPPSKGKSAYSVRKVLVKQEDGQWIQVTLKNWVRVKQVNKKLALPLHLMDFAERDYRKDVGTDARDDGPWKKGAATDKTGAGLRPLLEAVPLDSEELVVFASENCVGPALASDRDRLAPGCFVAMCTVANFGGNLRITFGGTTQAEANRAAAVQAIACAADHLKGDLDESPIFNGLSDELKDAARKARAGEPWMDQNLGRYLVRVLSDREKAALDQYLAKCRRLGRTPRIGKTPVAPSEKSWDDANKREGRGRHSLVRLSVELEH